MNVADSEVVVSLLEEKGYELIQKADEADLILINTCSIRENAEQRVRGRIEVFKHIKKNNPSLKLGIIGCMAERLKKKLLEDKHQVDLVVGPDAYRDLPDLIKETETGQKAINVILSKEETYGDINPVRYSSNGVSAFISIMRGCNNMCSYCVVPFVRGRERSRDPESIINEAKILQQDNYKEITLLGQNVDKYYYEPGDLNFAQLLNRFATKFPDIRVRFSTSYPSDMTDEVLQIMAKHKNICKSIHFPAQSGSTEVLKKMKRNYTREEYLERTDAIKRILPDCTISTDIIAGFCGETEKDHQDTLSLMKKVGFDFAFMFKYSERPNTYAQRKFDDDIPEEIKTRRLNEIIELQNQLSSDSKQNDLGKIFEVLVEGVSKKSENDFFGRNSQNKVIVFPKKNCKKGDIVTVKVNKATSATLIGEIV